MYMPEWLKKCWRAWGDYNNFVALLETLGWKDWLRDGLIFVAGTVVTGLLTNAVGWWWPWIWLSSVGSGGCLALLYIAYRLSQSTVGLRANSAEIGPRNENRAPSITAELSTAAMNIDGLDVACAIEVENRTDEYLHEKCLAKILEMSCPRPKSIPQDFALRTESQILGNRNGRFNLAAREKKTVPVLFQDKPRKDFLILIDENIVTRSAATKTKSKHYIPFPRQRLEMLIETSGAAVPGRYLLTLDRGPNWTLTPKIELVPCDYTLNKNDGALPIVAVSPAEDVLARIRAVIDVATGRLAYAKRTLQADDENDLKKWLRKVDDQRIDLSKVLSTDTTGLLPYQITKLTTCHLLHTELDRCIDNILSKTNYKGSRHAVGLYVQRAEKLHAALEDVIKELSEPAR